MPGAVGGPPPLGAGRRVGTGVELEGNRAGAVAASSAERGAVEGDGDRRIAGNESLPLNSNVVPAGPEVGSTESDGSVAPVIASCVSAVRSAK